MRAVIDVQGRCGYVWDADVARWLRQECGIVGAMIGGVAGFKQQNAVHGLPMELGAEEITLALARGWAELRSCRAGVGSSVTHDAERAKRKRDGSSSDESTSEDEIDSAPTARAAPEPEWKVALAQGTHIVIPTSAVAVRARAAPDRGRDAGGGGRPEPRPIPGPGDGSAASAVEGAARFPSQPGLSGEGATSPPCGDGGPSFTPVAWDYPATRAERARCAVFSDLHARGYRITGGSKFGADYLVYPGDPTLFHAQFCVRLVGYDTPLVAPLLAAACRGSHQARKHLLLASYVEQEVGKGDRQARVNGDGSDAARFSGKDEHPPEEGAVTSTASATLTGLTPVGGRVQYMTIGPVEGFG